VWRIRREGRTASHTHTNTHTHTHTHTPHRVPPAAPCQRRSAGSASRERRARPPGEVGGIACSRVGGTWQRRPSHRGPVLASSASHGRPCHRLGCHCHGRSRTRPDAPVSTLPARGDSWRGERDVLVGRGRPGRMPTLPSPPGEMGPGIGGPQCIGSRYTQYT
jgi:hypothetical protein